MSCPDNLMDNRVRSFNHLENIRYKMKDLTDTQKNSLQSGVSAVLLARTHAEVKREQVDEVYRDILNTFEIYTNPKEGKHRNAYPVERITENKDLWKANDVDYRDITDQADFELREKGIKPVEMEREYCPALVAEHIERKAVWVLFDIAEEFTGMSCEQATNSLERHKKYLDLLIGLGVNLPGFKNPLTGVAL